jgi:hypothetical protein
MSLLREIVAELIGMFLGDLRLSIGVALVVVASVVVARAGVGGTMAAGAVLLVGCLGVLVLAVILAARRAT